ncbi:TPA: CRISPR-associated endonuclease Cas3'' [Candidatus Bathyarchaeota archaeon]|nr:CRISPR-associated endonuclease Cas3'' [Candidatus Bathyarchaeota archaeon]
MNNKLYSWCGESLKKHSLETFKIYRLSFEEKIIKVLEGRLRCSFDDFSILVLRLTLLLHDIGKSHPKYQQSVRVKENCLNPDLKCNRCKYKPSFPWHEILSAYFYWKLIEELWFYCMLGDMHRELQTISTISVLTHHQAMREPMVECPSKDMDLKGWEVKQLSELILGLISSACEKLKVDTSKLRRTVNGTLNTLSEDFEKRNSLISLCRTLQVQLNESLQQRGRGKLKIYSIIAGSLVMCDWLAAEKYRKSSFTHPMLDEIKRSFPELRKH